MNYKIIFVTNSKSKSSDSCSNFSDGQLTILITETYVFTDRILSQTSLLKWSFKAATQYLQPHNDNFDHRREQTPLHFTKKELFKSEIGEIRYFADGMRHDIEFATGRLPRFLKSPKTENMSLLQHIIRYLVGTIHNGINFLNSSKHQLITSSDSNCAEGHYRRSASAYILTS